MGMKWMKKKIKKVTGKKKAEKRERYFASTYKGELFELKQQLNSNVSKERKDALKRVIGAMTIGKDVSSLFTDVLKCVHTTHIEQKKLVYLYLIHYAEAKPELAILAINMFTRDTKSYNAHIRALSLRTMASIRVDQVVEHLCTCLELAVNDTDAYVRKTAAVCIAKLAYIDPQRLKDQNFLDKLIKLAADSNAVVVSNAIAALHDISRIMPGCFKIDKGMLRIMLGALDECTEWGQALILDCITENVTPKTAHDADAIIDCVAARLQHANHSVALASARLIIKCMDKLTREETINKLLKKISRPLLSMVKDEQELQYVALRGIRAILVKYPTFLEGHLKEFFVQFNDQLYNKLEKLEVLVMLCTKENVNQVISELREYTLEVDTTFVKRSVEMFGAIAIKMEFAVYRCIDALKVFCSSTMDHIVQAAASTLVMILRTYPKHQFENIFPLMMRALRIAEDVDSRCSVIWALGQFAENIEDPAGQIRSVSDGFLEEPSAVQTQILAASVKLYARGIPESKSILEELVGKAMEDNSISLTIRDTAVFYLRLVESGITGPELLSILTREQKGLSVKTPDSSVLQGSLLDDVLQNYPRISALYYRPGEEFDAWDEEESDDADDDEDDPDHATDVVFTGETELIDLGDGTMLEIPTVAPLRGDALLQFDDEEGSSLTLGGDTSQYAGSSAGRNSTEGSRGGVSLLEELGIISMTTAQMKTSKSMGGQTTIGPGNDTIDGEALGVAGQQSNSGEYEASGSNDLTHDFTLLGLGDSKSIAANGGLPDISKGSASRAAPQGQILSRRSSKKSIYGKELKQAVPIVVLDKVSGNGLQVSGCLRTNKQNGLVYLLMLENLSSGPLTDFDIRFNKNAIGLNPADKLQLEKNVLEVNESGKGMIPLAINASNTDIGRGNKLEMAVKCNPLGVVYFSDFLDPYVHILLTGEDGEDAPPAESVKSEFQTIWASSKGTEQYQSIFDYAYEWNAAELADFLNQANYKALADADRIVILSGRLRDLGFAARIELNYDSKVAALELRVTSDSARRFANLISMIMNSLVGFVTG